MENLKTYDDSIWRKRTGSKSQLQGGKLRMYVEGPTFEGQIKLLPTSTMSEVIENLSSQLGCRPDQVKLSKTTNGPPYPHSLTIEDAGYHNDDVIYCRTTLEIDASRIQSFQKEVRTPSPLLEKLCGRHQQLTPLVTSSPEQGLIYPTQGDRQRQCSYSSWTTDKHGGNGYISNLSNFQNVELVAQEGDLPPSHAEVYYPKVKNLNEQWQDNGADSIIWERSCCNRFTDFFFMHPFVSASFRVLVWITATSVWIGDTYAILYLGWLIRDVYPRLAGSCVILFLSPWICVWGASLSIKEHYVNNDKIRCRCIVLMISTVCTLLPPVAIVLMQMFEVLYIFQEFLKRLMLLVCRSRRKQQYYNWCFADTWRRYRRFSQLFLQSLLQTGFLVYIWWAYFQDEPMKKELLMDNDVLYGCALLSTLNIIFACTEFVIRARRLSVSVSDYILHSQRVTPGTIFRENKKSRLLDLSLHMLNEQSAVVLVNRIRVNPKRIVRVVLTPTTLKNLSVSTCHHVGKMMKKEEIGLEILKDVHRAPDVFKQLSPCDGYILTNNFGIEMMKSGHFGDISQDQLKLIKTVFPKGKRLYYSQFKEFLESSSMKLLIQMQNALLWAAEQDNERFLQFLLGYGWMNRSESGKTALFYAIESMNNQLLRKIIATGRQATEEDHQMTSLLLLKITKENNVAGGVFISKLIKEGCFKINPLLYFQDEFRNTTLHYAAQLGRTELVRIFVESFTRTESEMILQPNSTGQTPLDLAVISKHNEIVTILRPYEAFIRAEH